MCFDVLTINIIVFFCAFFFFLCVFVDVQRALFLLLQWQIGLNGMS